MKKFIWLSFILIVSCGKSIQQNNVSLVSSNIIGGEYVDKNDLTEKSTVSTLNVTVIPKKWSKPKQTFIKQVCTGTLISPDLIVTAGHCEADNMGHGGVEYVWFGATLPTNGNYDSNNMIEIKSRKYAPKFTKDEATRVQDTIGADLDDVIIIHLSKNAPSGFKPASIIESDDFIDAGTPLIQAGFGNTTYDHYENGGNLKKITLPFDSYFDEKFLVNRGTVGEGTYSGDSGGPAYLQDGAELLLVGVVQGHLGDSPDPKAYPEASSKSLFINLSSYKQFILDTAKEMEAIAPVFKHRSLK